MKHKLLTLVLAAVVIMSLVVVGCAKPAPTPAPAEKPIQLSYAHFAPPTHIQSKEVEDWAAKIEKNTGGRVKITVYPAGTLAPAAEVYDDIVKGVIDIGMACPAHTPGRFPQHLLTNLPLGYPSTRVATLVMNDIYKEFEFKEVADTHVFYWYATGLAQIHSKRPIRTLEDLKGMRLSGVGMSEKVGKYLGATPTGISVSEVYLAIQKGIVEGNINPNEVLKSFKLAEVTQYTTEANLTTTSFVVAMNRDKWNSLPKDIQNVFEEVSEETLSIIMDDWEGLHEKGKEYAAAMGHEFITLSPEEKARWLDAIKPMIDDYVSGLDANGIEGTELCDEALRLIEKYSK